MSLIGLVHSALALSFDRADFSSFRVVEKPAEVKYVTIEVERIVERLVEVPVEKVIFREV